jgi:hypothetical protein
LTWQLGWGGLKIRQLYSTLTFKERKLMKVKELTLEQIKNICNEHYPSCRKDGKRCPLYHKTISCDSIISVIRSALRHNHDALEEEIVLEPKEKTTTPIYENNEEK